MNITKCRLNCTKSTYASFSVLQITILLHVLRYKCSPINQPASTDCNEISINMHSYTFLPGGAAATFPPNNGSFSESLVFR